MAYGKTDINMWHIYVCAVDQCHPSRRIGFLDISYAGKPSRRRYFNRIGEIRSAIQLFVRVSRRECRTVTIAQSLSAKHKQDKMTSESK